MNDLVEIKTVLNLFQGGETGRHTKGQYNQLLDEVVEVTFNPIVGF